MENQPEKKENEMDARQQLDLPTVVNDIRIIKYCCIFFVVLAAIGIIGALLLAKAAGVFEAL